MNRRLRIFLCAAATTSGVAALGALAGNPALPCVGTGLFFGGLILAAGWVPADGDAAEASTAPPDAEEVYMAAPAPPMRPGSGPWICLCGCIDHGDVDAAWRNLVAELQRDGAS